MGNYEHNVKIKSILALYDCYESVETANSVMRPNNIAHSVADNAFYSSKLVRIMSLFELYRQWLFSNCHSMSHASLATSHNSSCSALVFFVTFKFRLDGVKINQHANRPCFAQTHRQPTHCSVWTTKLPSKHSC